jgi:hypothetical protein
MSVKLCQELCRYPPTLTDATDAEIQQFRRWPTPTDARKSLPKQVRYRTAPRPVNYCAIMFYHNRHRGAIVKTVAKTASEEGRSAHLAERSDFFDVGRIELQRLNQL